MAVHQTTASIIVGGDPTRAFEAWSGYDRFPEFMPHVVSVRRTGERTSHWTARGPLGRTVEWDAEITRLERDKRIAWASSHDGAFKTSGQVTFNALPGGQTEVTLVFQYATSAAREAIARALSDLERVVREDLRSFKAHVESRGASDTPLGIQGPLTKGAASR
jgi:uncharacterized membrane protein